VSCCRHSMGLLSLVFDLRDRDNRMSEAELFQAHISDIIRFQSCAILYSSPFNATADLFILSPRPIVRNTGYANNNVPVTQALTNKRTVH
jgi:hypothetical protein